MELISKTERTNVTILAKIAGVDVNINYERTTGQQPQSINAGCNLPAPVEGAQPTYINITRQGNGHTQVSLNGDINITEIAALVEAIKAELEIIAAEGVVA